MSPEITVVNFGVCLASDGDALTNVVVTAVTNAMLVSKRILIIVPMIPPMSSMAMCLMAMCLIAICLMDPMSHLRSAAA